MAPTTNTPAISVRHLTKRFGSRRAVDDMTFTVPPGAVAGFVGPNGAGKTTTLRMLVGLVRPTSGGGEVLGRPIGAPVAYLARVGALIERPAFYGALTGRRNLAVLAHLAGVDAPRIDAVLALVDLADRADDPFRTYSLGMKQRLAIAGALLRDPDVLILDEPTNGLDPAGIRDMRALVRRIAGRGLTILVSSHLLGEIESVCDWLVVVQRGRLAYEGPTAALVERGERFVVVPASAPDLEPLARLARDIGLDACIDDHRLVVAGCDAAAAAELNRRAAQQGITLAELTRERTSLEDRYFEITAGAS